MPRLIVELTENQHYEIKNRAALEGKSIKNYVIEILFNKQQKVKIPEKLLKDSKFFEALKDSFTGKGKIKEQDLFSFFEKAGTKKEEVKNNRRLSVVKPVQSSKAGNSGKNNKKVKKG